MTASVFSLPAEAETHHWPLWVQVEQAILRAIRAGKLKPGEQLPGEHQLAEDLGIHRHTVRRAIKSLGGRGLLEFAADVAPSSLPAPSPIVSAAARASPTTWRRREWRRRPGCSAQARNRRRKTSRTILIWRPPSPSRHSSCYAWATTCRSSSPGIMFQPTAFPDFAERFEPSGSPDIRELRRRWLPPGASPGLRRVSPARKKPRTWPKRARRRFLLGKRQRRSARPPDQLQLKCLRRREGRDCG